MDQPSLTSASRFSLGAAVIIVLAALLVPIGLLIAGPKATQDATPEAGESQAVAATPVPWQYDPATNRHWDPGHGHWHDGPAPQSAGGQVPAVPLGPAGQAAATPQPWQYDAANDRYWDPGHGHWHPGSPPQAAAGQAPAATPVPVDQADATTPAPWQYDAANDRHWNPDHGHWHPGPPPPGKESP